MSNDITKKGNWTDGEKEAMRGVSPARMVDQRQELFDAAAGKPCLLCGCKSQVLARVEVSAVNFGGCSELFIPLCLGCLPLANFDEITEKAQRLTHDELAKNFH